MKSKGEMSGFGLLIAVIIGVVVIFFLTYSVYPTIPVFGQAGMEASKSASIVGMGIDLMVSNNSISSFNCSGNYVKVYNLGEVDVKNVMVEISGAVGRTLYVDLPSGAALPVQLDTTPPIGKGVITVEVDRLNTITEKLEDNNLVKKTC